MEQTGFCQKDNKSVPLSKGCLQPSGYCPHRTSCMLYFIEKNGGFFDEDEDKSAKRSEDEDTVDK